MKRFVTLSFCLSLGIFAVAPVITGSHMLAAAANTVSNPTEQQADAKTLLDDANKALAAMIKAARVDQGLDPKTPKNKPFWKATQLVAKNLKTARAGLDAKSNDFFKGVTEGRKAEEQLKVDWKLTDSRNQTVLDNGKKLGHAIALLRTNFSKEAARKKEGGELTTEEKTQLAKIKAQQKELLAKISKLEKAAQKDKALEHGLTEIQKQVEHISKQPATVDAYIATLYLLDVQVGLIRGYKYYVDAPWRADYVFLVNWTSSYERSYYAWETTVSYDWASVDVSVDIREYVAVSESLSEEQINSEESYVENESFDMSEAEQEKVAAEEDSDQEVASADEDSMEDASDNEGEDMGNTDSSADESSADDDDNGGDDDAAADERGGDEGD